jgi:hypothetical protein
MSRMDVAKDSADLPGLDPLDGGAGPARPLTETEARALVAGVLGKALPVVPRRNVVRLWRAPRMGLAVIAMTTAAAAYRGGGWVIEQWSGPRSSAAGSMGSSGANAPAPAAKAPSEHVARGVEPSPVSEPLPREAPSPARANPAPKARAMTRAETPPAARGTPPAPERTELRFEPEAVDTLARANSARGARRYADALALYSSIVAQYPESLQAQAARVAAAALSLEQFRDAAAAERLYRDAVQRGSELAEEARFGLAESYRAQGDVTRERAALREFLLAHPHSPLASTAQARSKALGP